MPDGTRNRERIRPGAGIRVDVISYVEVDAGDVDSIILMGWKEKATKLLDRCLHTDFVDLSRFKRIRMGHVL